MASLDHAVDPRTVLTLMWDVYCTVPSEVAAMEEHGIRGATWVRQMMNAGVDTVGIRVAGALAGGAYFNGRRIHLAIAPEYYARWFPALRPLLEYGFSVHGAPLVALVNMENTRAIQFVRQVGCVPVDVHQKWQRFEVRPENMRFRKR